MFLDCLSPVFPWVQILYQILFKSFWINLTNHLFPCKTFTAISVTLLCHLFSSVLVFLYWCLIFLSLNSLYLFFCLPLHPVWRFPVIIDAAVDEHDDSHKLLSIVGWIMSLPPNLHSEALTLNLTIFWDRAFKEAIKVKWGHKHGALIL